VHGHGDLDSRRRASAADNESANCAAKVCARTLRKSYTGQYDPQPTTAAAPRHADHGVEPKARRDRGSPRALARLYARL